MRWVVPTWALLCLGCAGQTDLTINQIQFVGSHNSYKKAMSPEHARALRLRNPAAADSLAYTHLPLAQQLDLGLRKLELDVFYDPAAGSFPVGHVQQIDMNSHCADLAACLGQIAAWSDAHPEHVPIWISFNAKDQKIEGLADPAPFTPDAFDRLDRVLETLVGDRLIRPREVAGLRWPRLSESRGRLLLVLDETGRKRQWYAAGWPQRPMFLNAPEGHAAAAVMIINDPIARGQDIRRLVAAGYMVRTRADADTVEARNGDTARREAAFGSGAQAVSTDYYLPAARFGTGYQVTLDGGVRCNPVNAPPGCVLAGPR